MAAAITLNMFCSNAGFTAGKPRSPNQQLNFTATPRSDNPDDDNASVFPDQNNKGASLNLNGVKPEIAAQFASAPRVRVTVEILEDGKDA
jgi:hypothetical protein